MRVQITAILLILAVINMPFYTAAQLAITMPKNEYGLQVIDNEETYKISEKLDINQKMVSIKQMIPSIALDLKYTTSDNFMHKPMYALNTNDTYMRVAPAEALRKVQMELNTNGLGLKIFDAYRPYSVTKDFWRKVHKKNFVAHPANGSGHNRGIAVDITIINIKSGNELDMGTGFDNFSDSAHQKFQNLSSYVLNNRALLRNVMRKYGFIMYDTEWWHYSWPGSDDYYLLDLSFDQLKNLTK